MRERELASVYRRYRDEARGTAVQAGDEEVGANCAHSFPSLRLMPCDHQLRALLSPSCSLAPLAISCAFDCTAARLPVCLLLSPAAAAAAAPTSCLFRSLASLYPHARSQQQQQEQEQKELQAVELIQQRASAGNT